MRLGIELIEMFLRLKARTLEGWGRKRKFGKVLKVSETLH